MNKHVALIEAAQQALTALVSLGTDDVGQASWDFAEAGKACFALRQAIHGEQQEDKNLAEAFRVELDKLSQRNYELRMENTALKSTQNPMSVGEAFAAVAPESPAHNIKE